jgi:hypothetical protein
MEGNLAMWECKATRKKRAERKGGKGEGRKNKGGYL